MTLREYTLFVATNSKPLAPVVPEEVSHEAEYDLFLKRPPLSY